MLQNRFYSDHPAQVKSKPVPLIGFGAGKGIVKYEEW